MRSICRAWRAAIEAAATRVCIKKSPLPLNLGLRFHLLASLDLQKCTQLTAVSLSSLQSLPHLTSLTLKLPPPSLYEPTSGIISALKGLPLAKLDIVNLGHFFPSSDSGMEMLRGLPLVRLDLSLAEDVTRTSLNALVGIPLTSLKLCKLETESPVTAHDLDVLEGMPLSSLSLGYCELSNDEVRNLLRRLPFLTELDLGQSCFYERGWSGLCLAVLEGLPLTSLTLGFSNQFTGADLGSLRDLPLKHLCLGVANFGPSSGMLAGVRELPFLSSLGLGLNNYHTDWIGDLQGMHITGLDLGSNHLIQDHDLGALVGLPLELLKLSPSITDGSLALFAEMPLKHLDVSRAGISKAGIDQLRSWPLVSLIVRDRCHNHLFKIMGQDSDSEDGYHAYLKNEQDFPPNLESE